MRKREGLLCAAVLVLTTLSVFLGLCTWRLSAKANALESELSILNPTRISKGVSWLASPQPQRRWYTMTITPDDLEDDPNLPDKVKRFVEKAQAEARYGRKSSTQGYR